MISPTKRTLPSRRRAAAAGVFYTREDVTGYIAERTILPVILAVAAAHCPESFRPQSPAWRLLAANPDRYIPAAIRHGVDLKLPTARSGRHPPPEFGLPTEIWSEHLARRARCAALRRELHEGRIHAVNDLVTLNLDIVRWTSDVIAGATAPLRAALVEAAEAITVLDPTCGDGAFLRGAQRVLEEIQVTLQPRPLDAIRRSLLQRNLYGVDVRAQAVADCQRTVLAPLIEVGPDAATVDLHQSIRCGNALTGGVRQVGRSARRGTLDWENAFPTVMGRGGFDVIIGNPPYVRADRAGYRVAADFATAGCPDVYAWVLERAAELLRPGGRCGMIVPLSLAFSADFAACRRLLFAGYDANWFASFGRIPAALFASDIRVRNVIHLGRKRDASGPIGVAPQAKTTRLHRWFEEARPFLFEALEYAQFDPTGWNGQVPKLGSARLLGRFEERLRRGDRLGASLSPTPTGHVLHYKQTAYNWLTFCRRLPPCYDAAGRPGPQTQFETLYFRAAWQRDAALLLLNGKWAFAYWIAVGDDFHVTRRTIAELPIDLEEIPRQLRVGLCRRARRLEQAMARATAFKRNAGKRVGTYNLARCRGITDTTDRLFADMFDLADVWPDVELLCAQVVKTHFADDV
ncbi:hypothetical protein AYO44_08220 [Planctomycetaceae bacterium SCGC AG-212-F19]|nr:hypothetical protein AYO44_08220 [Planctomycetaceae bacterium SCGC AG-212-F19]